MVVVDHINNNIFYTALDDKVVHTLNGLPKQVCGADDFTMTGLESIQIAKGLKS